jgi:hypothetical protein
VHTAESNFSPRGTKRICCRLTHSAESGIVSECARENEQSFLHPTGEPRSLARLSLFSLLSLRVVCLFPYILCVCARTPALCLLPSVLPKISPLSAESCKNQKMRCDADAFSRSTAPSCSVFIFNQHCIYSREHSMNRRAHHIILICPLLL